MTTIEQAQTYINAVDSGRIKKRPMDDMQGLARLALALHTQLQREREARERMEWGLKRMDAGMTQELLLELCSAEREHWNKFWIKEIRSVLGAAALQPSAEAQGEGASKTVNILHPDKLCPHFDQLGDLIHWQTTINMKTGEEGIIPTLDKGSGKKRKQAIIYYCPLCGQPTYEEIQPEASK